jgi:hypothetical protein
MSMRSHFVPGHHFVHRAHRIDNPRTMTTTEVHSRLSQILLTIGGLGIVAGAWGGIAPFVGPTFGYTADGGGSWHWDLARAMLAALPGAAAFVAGMLIVACARSAALPIGRGGLTLASLVMFASGAWIALGPWAWPVLWSNGYFIHTDALGDFGRTAGFAVAPGVVLATLAGFTMGALVLRERGRLVTDDAVMERPVDTAGSRSAALSDDDDEYGVVE